MSLPWIPPYTSSYNSSLCSLNHNLHFSCVPLNSQYYKTKKKLIPNTNKKTTMFTSKGIVQTRKKTGLLRYRLQHSKILTAT